MLDPRKSYGWLIEGNILSVYSMEEFSQLSFWGENCHTSAFPRTKVRESASHLEHYAFQPHHGFPSTSHMQQIGVRINLAKEGYTLVLFQKSIFFSFFLTLLNVVKAHCHNTISCCLNSLVEKKSFFLFAYLCFYLGFFSFTYISQPTWTSYRHQLSTYTCSKMRVHFKQMTKDFADLLFW